MPKEKRPPFGIEEIHLEFNILLYFKEKIVSVRSNKKNFFPPDWD